MSVEKPIERTEQELTYEQRETLRRLNGHMPEILSRFDAVLARYGIDRRVHRFGTMTAARTDSGTGSGCAMACCSCPPPEEACIEDCPKCVEAAEAAEAAEPGVERPKTLPDEELSDEQRRTLELLNGNMMALLAELDAVLAGYDVDRRVHRFTTTTLQRDDAGSCFMVCCVCPPPDEACTGHCSKCTSPDGGTGDGGTGPVVV